MKRLINNYLQLARILPGSSGLILLVILILSVSTGCEQKKVNLQPDSGFSKYITSFTAGTISVKAPVVLQLRDIPPGLEPGKPLPAGLFRFEPSVKGDPQLNGSGEIRFVPTNPLESGRSYKVTFLLEKIMDVEKPFKALQFSFSTIKQNYSVEEDGLYTDAALSKEKMSYSGTVQTADVVEPSLLEKVLQIVYDGKIMIPRWDHSIDQRIHHFMVDSLDRAESKSTALTIQWDGTPIGVENKGVLQVQVPAKNEFKVLTVKAQKSPEQRIEILFSDPVALDQPVEGMIELNPKTNFTWQIDGNQMVIWPSEELSGVCYLMVFPGFKNTGGSKIEKLIVFPFFVSNLKPQIRLLGKGVIIPDKGNLSFPFEAVSLRAVDLRVIQIYASNVRQFLQENQINEGEGIRKVGRLVYSGKIELTPDHSEQLYRWNTYRIDLNRFITTEPGAIYRVELRFKKDYSLYTCNNETSESVTSASDREEAEEDWDSPDWYDYYYWPEDYDWDERENPCHNSYYTSNHFVSKNILASDLGMIVKGGSGNCFSVIMTNLLTALPEVKAEISFFDLQHQLIGKCISDDKGFAAVTLARKPFVVIAQKGNQIAYLRVDDGSSLSLSNFDIAGEAIQDGIKGFLFGERGVWRPGDELFFTFILDDPQDQLPGNTPVIFRLTNSRGQEVDKQIATTSENGFYHFPVRTRPDAPTGNWYARVQVGGATFEKRIKIETVKPNRLKIDLSLPVPMEAGKKQTALLRSSWLQGTAAPFLQAVVETEMFPMKTTFKGYEKFCFDDPGSYFYPVQKRLFEGRLDAKGEAVIPLEFAPGMNAPGKLKAWFTTRVFEGGGDFSIFVQQAEFSPFNRYLGLRMPEEQDGWYQTGAGYEPEIVALSPEGKPVPLGKVEISLYKIDWRWWWESGEDQLAHYVSGRNYEPVKRFSIESGGVKEKFGLTVDYHSWKDNGRYLLYAKDPESGHGTGITFYMNEWGGWRSGSVPEGATMLTLRTDKDKYAPGEKIRVTLPSSASCQALVSLEDGRQVKDIFWVKTTENETYFDIEVKPGMAPTLYIYVTLLQPYGSAQNDAPVRLYGVTAVAVEDPSTVLHPVIKMQEELLPEKDFKVTVREQDGREMTYILAIVDEGLLDLTGFKTPDPHAHFYTREALGVRTWDLFDYVAGAYGAQLEKAFAIGGDEERQVSGQKQANRFQPVVLFSVPFTLRKGESKSHALKMPNYVGSVRVMVIAGAKHAFGNCEKTVKVRSAVMLLPTLPRVAGPGEEFSIPVSVFAMKETTKNVTVRMTVNDEIAILGNPLQEISFGAPGEKMVFFRVKTKTSTGIARVKITATSGNETASFDTELEIRNPNPPVVSEINKLLDPDQSWSPEIVMPGLPGTNEVYLELAGVPGLNLKKHLDELVQYPHGCCEQIVSTGFAQLFLENLIQLTPFENSEIEENVKGTLLTLRGMQTSSGGFALWPGQNTPDPWSTSFAGHFMILAGNKGYTVPVDMKSRWLSFQASQARNWKAPATGSPFIRYQEQLIQAYRLYALALAGSPEQGVMNRFREEAAGFPKALWRLAAAYYLTGQQAVAEQLLQQKEQSSIPYEDQGVSYGSELRDKAMKLETLLLMNDRKKAFPLMSEIAAEIGKSDWLSTQTASWCLYAISKFYVNGSPASGTSATITINGKQESHRMTLPLLKLPLETGKSTSVKTKVHNTGTTPLYVSLVARGTPLEDSGNAVENNIMLKSGFVNREGNDIDPGSLPQGTDLFLDITVIHPAIRGTYHNLALSAIFPSGWEILNDRLFDKPENQSLQLDYQDVRDDRVYSYFSLRESETKHIRIALHASYEGRFYLPPLVVEGMYDHSVFAKLPGQWVTVKK
jgi:alpha-2-macroglobulin